MVTACGLPVVVTSTTPVMAPLAVSVTVHGVPGGKPG